MFFIFVLGDRDLVPGLEEQNRDACNLNTEYQKYPELWRLHLPFRSDRGYIIFSRAVKKLRLETVLE